MRKAILGAALLLAAAAARADEVRLKDGRLLEGTIDLFGGVRVVDTVHVALFIFFIAFIFIHPYLASLGHPASAHFKAMVTGYEEVEEEPGSTRR